MRSMDWSSDVCSSVLCSRLRRTMPMPHDMRRSPAIGSGRRVNEKFAPCRAWRKWLSVDIAWKVQRASHDPFGDGAECDLLGVAIREGGRRLLDRPSQILEFGVKDIARLRPTSRSGEVE